VPESKNWLAGGKIIFRKYSRLSAPGNLISKTDSIYIIVIADRLGDYLSQ